MSAVGIVSIALGLLVVFGRGGPLVVAPVAYLRWLMPVRRRLSQTNKTTRILGACLLILGATMFGAGTTGDSTLADILMLGGIGGVTVGAALVIGPGMLRKFSSAFLPAVEDERLLGWRVIGLLVTVAGVVLIYFGVLAL